MKQRISGNTKIERGWHLLLVGIESWEVQVSHTREIRDESYIVKENTQGKELISIIYVSLRKLSVVIKEVEKWFSVFE